MVRRTGLDRRQQQAEVSIEGRQGKERRLLDDRRVSTDRRFQLAEVLNDRRARVYIDRRAQPIF